MLAVETTVPPAPRGRLRLATAARVRTLAWPRYDDPADLDRLFGRYAALHAEREDVCLCLRHDPALDVPLEQAVVAVDEAYRRLLGPGTRIDLLVVDDALDAEGWRELGRQVTCAVRLPSSEEPERAEILSLLGVPLVDDIGALRERLGGEAIASRPAAAVPIEIRCDRPNVVLIRGQSRQGKSLLAQAFRETLAPACIFRPDQPFSAARCTTLGTDALHVDFVRRHCPHKAPASWTPSACPEISRHWRDGLDDAERAAFAEHVCATVEAALRTTERWVVVEGWHLQHVGERVVAALAGRANVIPIDLENYVLRVGGEIERPLRVPLMTSDNRADRAGRIVAQGTEIVRDLVALVRGKYVAELLPRTRYQCFEDLGQDRRNSNSAAKLAALHLPPLAGMRALDVGCNSGYFSIRMRQLGARSVLGLDTSADEIRLARQYRDLVYELDGLEFERADAFDLDPARRFDLILCASVFHYFRERQREFLPRALRLLDPGGLLVLECGLSDKEPGRPFVEERARAVDRGAPCHFPNEKALLEMAAGFRVEWRGPSVTQPGDAQPRTVLHLRRA
jgi:SAM-dependent methyltransferase